MATLPRIKSSKNVNYLPLLQKTVHSGWMWKKGALNQLVNRRWFEIKGDQLYYFKEKGDSNVLGQISLAGNEIKRHNALADSNSGKYVFELVAGAQRKDRPVHEKHDSLIFGTTTPYEMEEWIKAINRILYTPAGGGMFGRSLQETIKVDSIRGGGMVPIIVEKCVEFLKMNAVNEEGIFRVPGLKDDIEILKIAFNKGDIIEFKGLSYKVNVVASVLKQYIGDLPESVIPPGFYDGFISIDPNCQKNADQVIKEYRELLSKVPIENFNLLKYICRFLFHLQSFQETTKMSLSNLALVFGPNILRPENEDPAMLLKSLSDVNATTTALITHHKELFPVLDNEHCYRPIEDLQNRRPLLAAINMLYGSTIEYEDDDEPISRDVMESPSGTFLNKKTSSSSMRRSRSETNLYTFVNIDNSSSSSNKDYYDWTSHLKNEMQDQKKHFEKQIGELENKLVSEMKIREMLKLRLNDEHKARVSAEERVELYKVGIEEFCKTFGSTNFSLS